MKHSLFTIIFLIMAPNILHAENNSVATHAFSSTYENSNPSPLSKFSKIRNSEIYDIDISLHVLKASPIEVSGNEPWGTPIKSSHTCLSKLIRSTLC